MDDDRGIGEAVRLVSDWAKWLVTIETFAIAILGSLFTSDKVLIPQLAKILGVAAIMCFVTSIAFAAILLLTLPEIVQTSRQDNIWTTRDSIVWHTFRLNTQSLAVFESVFFGFGIILTGAVIITVISPSPYIFVLLVVFGLIVLAVLRELLGG